MVQMQKPKHSTTKSQIYFPVQALTNRPSPVKLNIKRSIVKHPRTCNESPEAVGVVSKPDQKSQEHQVIKVRGIIKVSRSKNRVKRTEVQSDLKNFADVFISPIQKIPFAFVNKEDNSLIRALEL